VNRLVSSPLGKFKMTRSILLWGLSVFSAQLWDAIVENRNAEIA